MIHRALPGATVFIAALAVVSRIPQVRSVVLPQTRGGGFLSSIFGG